MFRSPTAWLMSGLALLALTGCYDHQTRRGFYSICVAADECASNYCSEGYCTSTCVDSRG